jgi:hypothetical protein
VKRARTRALHRKHAGTVKHTATSKHTPSSAKKTATAHKQAATQVVHHTKAAKLRQWSPDEQVAVCSARAVAQSLQMTLGVRLSDADVLGLHEAAGGHPDAGATILDALEAVQRRGLCGHRPVSYQPFEFLAEDVPPHPLILGVDWPEPHAVVALNGLWWSWGEPYSPWTGAVSEAWAVTWA